MDNPSLPVMSVLELLDELQRTGPRELTFIKMRAKELQDALLRMSVPGQMRIAEASAPRSAYDNWVVELFHATESAIPREALLRDFARRFAQVHGIKSEGSGARILVLHYLAAQGGSQAQVSGFFQQGLGGDQWKRFQEHLAQHQADPALRRLFSEHGRFETDYLPYMQQGGYYRGVFDAAFGRAKGSARNDFAEFGPNAWISAQALFGDDAREAHAVVMLYPNEGRYFEYREPSKSGQDLRLLDVLAAVYRQLDNQIKNLAVQVVRAREQLLARLGPAVLHHEVGGLARQVSAVLTDGLEDWRAFEQEYEPPAAVASMGQRIELSLGWIEKVIVTTEAFMNLERRGVVAAFSIRDVLEQVMRMVIVRCGGIGALLRTEPATQAEDSEQTPCSLRNDATLIMHALLNLVSNALDAMEERYYEWQREGDAAVARGLARPAPWRSIVEVRWTRRALPPGCVGWEVVNTGPPIPAAVRSRIFERGYTTRRDGHGQGLHLARMVAQYCGGDIALMADEELDAQAGEAVGFAYWVASDHHVTKELSL